MLCAFLHLCLNHDLQIISCDNIAILTIFDNTVIRNVFVYSFEVLIPLNGLTDKKAILKGFFPAWHKNVIQNNERDFKQFGISGNKKQPENIFPRTSPTPAQQLSSWYDSLNTHMYPNIYAYIRKTEVMDNN